MPMAFWRRWRRKVGISKRRGKRAKSRDFTLNSVGYVRLKAEHNSKSALDMRARRQHN